MVQTERWDTFQFIMTIVCEMNLVVTVLHLHNSPFSNFVSKTPAVYLEKVHRSPYLLNKLNIIEPYCTLRPSRTLLFSGLPMMIWQKKYFSHFTVNRNERTCQMTEIQNCTLWFDKKTASIEFCQLQINLEAKSMYGSSWKKDSIISKFALFFAGQVLFTVNGLL